MFWRQTIASSAAAPHHLEKFGVPASLGSRNAQVASKEAFPFIYQESSISALPCVPFVSGPVRGFASKGFFHSSLWYVSGFGLKKCLRLSNSMSGALLLSSPPPLLSSSSSSSSTASVGWQRAPPDLNRKCRVAECQKIFRRYARWSARKCQKECDKTCQKE